MQQTQKQARLPPEVNRILFVKGMPYDITAEEIYDLFGKYGSIRQVRLYVLSSFIALLLIN
jgi:pre-mRNA branch site protein p14